MFEDISRDRKSPAQKKVLYVEPPGNSKFEPTANLPSSPRSELVSPKSSIPWCRAPSCHSRPSHPEPGRGVQSVQTTLPSISASVAPDPLNNEFTYYSSILKNLVPALTMDKDRRAALPWIRKLFAPEYHSSRFRGKRNRYLAYLTITLLNDEVRGVFASPPPLGALPEVTSLPCAAAPPPSWMAPSFWEDVKLNGPFRVPCVLHGSPDNCPKLMPNDSAKIMDLEFRYMLWLAQPYINLLPREDSTNAGEWLYFLCRITEDACPVMRGVRNDYMTALLSCLHDLQVSGPFGGPPPRGALPALGSLASSATPASVLPLHPASRDADDFLREQPRPTEGAFAYIGITGDMMDVGFSA